MKVFMAIVKWTIIYVVTIILFITVIFFFMTILGCDESTQKKQFAKPGGMSWEVYVYLRCSQASRELSDGVLKDTVTHNALECKNLETGVLNRNKLNRSFEIYKYCADEKTRLKTHSWQECYNILK